MSITSELFYPVAPEHRLHPAFRDLRDSVFHTEARALMNSLFRRMGDPNGNFLDDFQTDGFHSRLFELACFAYLENAGFSLDCSHHAPDFIASRNGIRLAFEATTANPSTGRGTDISALRMQELSNKELLAKVSEEFPRRMRSILIRKANHNYHELEQCKGTPLVLMVAPFFEPGAVFYSDEALIECLYANDAGSGFFNLPDATPISAVLYCNAFTVPRFFRMATDFTKTHLEVIREGVCYRQSSQTTFSVSDFKHQVGNSRSPNETWAEGVTLFINPDAQIAIPMDLLPRTCTIFVKNGRLHRQIHGFHPAISFMIVNVSQE